MSNRAPVLHRPTGTNLSVAVSTQPVIDTGLRVGDGTNIQQIYGSAFMPAGGVTSAGIGRTLVVDDTGRVLCAPPAPASWKYDAASGGAGALGVAVLFALVLRAARSTR